MGTINILIPCAIIILGLIALVLLSRDYMEVNKNIPTDFDDTDLEAFEKFNAASEELYKHDQGVQYSHGTARFIVVLIVLLIILLVVLNL